MLFTEAEPSVLCPVSMTYAATPALRANAALYADSAPGWPSTAYDPRFVPLHAEDRALTMGMGMTEKQGGCDVRANTTRAEHDGSDAWGERYAHHRPQVVLLGADVRRLPGAGADDRRPVVLLPAALACPTARVNAIAIQRLKDKLGNHANASSEVEFDGAHGWLVGEEGRGVPQILAMGALTRLDCALGTAGLMRQALSIALHHTAQRQRLRQGADRAAADEERARRPGARKRSRDRAGAAAGGGASTPPSTASTTPHEAVMRRAADAGAPSSGSASAAATSRRRRWSAWAATATSKPTARA